MGALEEHQRGAVPPGLNAHFRHTKDDAVGDRERHHLFCYYVNADSAGSKGKFHAEWSISGTELATAPDSQALVDERHRVNVELFARQIREELVRDNMCLLEQGDRLVRKNAMGVPGGGQAA